MRVRLQTALLVCLLLLASGVSGSSINGGDTLDGHATITEIAYTGAEEVATSSDRLQLWQSGPHEFTVTIRTERAVSGDLCLRTVDDGSTLTLACETVSLAGGVETVAVSIGDWPRNATGEQTLEIRIINRTTGEQHATSERAITVFRKTGDQDADGLTNQEEVSAGTDLTREDTDADGLDDRIELEVYGTDPLAADTDSDGLRDGPEVRAYHTDPTATDTDDDGLPDGAEVIEYGTDPNRPDTDGDGLTDSAEVNAYQTNATAADTDGDGLGDGLEVKELDTDPTGTDTDGDGLSDGREHTILGTDPTTADTDGDGLDDAAEVLDYQTDPTESDTDGDSLSDGAEVNMYGTDPNAADTDSDGLRDGVEIRRGTDPTQPTVTTGGPLQFILGSATPLPTGLLLGGVVALGLALVMLGTRLDIGPSMSAIRDRLGRSGPTSEATRETAVAAGSGAGAADDDRSGVPDATGSATAGGDTDASSEEARVLTNEERVIHLLDTNGGRMLQSDMVDAADWSKATVSRVLSEMEDADAVTRIDIGKGNLVAHPDEEPDDITSAFADG